MANLFQILTLAGRQFNVGFWRSEIFFFHIKKITLCFSLIFRGVLLPMFDSAHNQSESPSAPFQVGFFQKA
jgi:hypothetical protein